MTNNPEGKASAVTPDDQLIKIDDHGAFAVLTINRPEKRNALSRETVRRLRIALEDLVGKQAVILTGTGKSFCAGMDLNPNEWGSGPKTEKGSELSRWEHPWTEVHREIRQHPAIFIAAVNGYALGGGSTLIHSCDLAIAAESAQIGAPEMGFGGFASHAAPSAAKRLLPKHAAEIIFLARRVSGHDAYRMGLVNRVLPDDEVMPSALEWAEQLSNFNPVALDWGKRTLRGMENLTWDDSMEFTKLNNTIAASFGKGTTEGATAFVNGHRGVGQGA